jgi:hypothetical protein
LYKVSQNSEPSSGLLEQSPRLAGVEEAAQGVSGLLGGLLREEVPGAQGVPPDVVAPLSPEGDRSALPHWLFCGSVGTSVPAQYQSSSAMTR